MCPFDTCAYRHLCLPTLVPCAYRPLCLPIVPLCPPICLPTIVPNDTCASMTLVPHRHLCLMTLVPTDIYAVKKGAGQIQCDHYDTNASRWPIFMPADIYARRYLCPPIFMPADICARRYLCPPIPCAHRHLCPQTLFAHDICARGFCGDRNIGFKRLAGHMQNEILQRSISRFSCTFSQYLQ